MSARGEPQFEVIDGVAVWINLALIYSVEVN
jgi:hypothetical protein